MDLAVIYKNVGLGVLGLLEQDKITKQQINIAVIKVRESKGLAGRDLIIIVELRFKGINLECRLTTAEYDEFKRSKINNQ